MLKENTISQTYYLITSGMSIAELLEMNL